MKNLHLLLLSLVLFFHVESRQDCTRPIGLKDGRMKDFQFTATSYLEGHDPHKARLDGPSCWIPDKDSDQEEWISIDFNGEYKVTSYVMQGGKGLQFQFFGMAYLTTKRRWQTLKNSLPYMQQNDNQKIPLTESPSVNIRGIRFILRKNVIGEPCFRFEVYGCKGPGPPWKSV